MSRQGFKQMVEGDSDQGAEGGTGDTFQDIVRAFSQFGPIPIEGSTSIEIARNQLAWLRKEYGEGEATGEMLIERDGKTIEGVSYRRPGEPTALVYFEVKRVADLVETTEEEGQDVPA